MTTTSVYIKHNTEDALYSIRTHKNTVTHKDSMEHKEVWITPGRWITLKTLENQYTFRIISSIQAQNTVKYLCETPVLFGLRNKKWLQTQNNFFPVRTDPVLFITILANEEHKVRCRISINRKSFSGITINNKKGGYELTDHVKIEI